MNYLCKMSFRLSIILISFLLLQARIMNAENDSLTKINYKNRKITLGVSGAVFSAGSIVYLNHAWFEPYNTGKFHFFNDNKEWNQMDKCGHAFTCYQTGRLMMDAFDWAGYNKNTKLIVAGGIGLYYMTAMEVMDGFSEGWGFSAGDIGANALGAGLAVSQEAVWKEQRVLLKFSYSQSGLAEYDPSLLGENIYTQVLKDYNGQTYWLSVNPSSFMKKQNKFPKWLNVAFGYSSYGMLGGFANEFAIQDKDGNVYRYDRERRYYFSLDVDLTRIKTRSKFLKGLFSAFNVLKFPAPALQLSKKGARGYWIYM